MAKYGLFCGMFNPVHIGHLMVADEAVKQKDLDTVIFMPSANPYHKNTSSVVDGYVRLDMVSRACWSNKKFVFSDFEIRRKDETFMVDILEALHNKIDSQKDSVYLILGDDDLLDILSWKNADKIFNLCTILVFVRDSSARKSAEMSANMLSEQYGANIEIMNTRCLHISSTDVRERILNGRSFRYLVSDPVYEYIVERGLYGYTGE